MSLITYPLNGVTYDAEDVGTYLCTRTSGIYAKDTNFAISITGTREITVSPGLAWINYDDFKGVSVCSRENTALVIPPSDDKLDRIDRIVLRFDSNANRSEIKLITGTLSGTPTAPEILKNHRQYELGLCTVKVAAKSTTVFASDITDTRLDEELCGVMRDGVTGIPTDALLTQAKARINELEQAADASAKAAQSSASDAKSSASAAKTSQSAAASSASTANTKASEAAASAKTAQDSATAAKSSQTAAASSASSAKADAAVVTEMKTFVEQNVGSFYNSYTLTLPVSGWQSHSGEPDGYAYRMDAALSASTTERLPVASIDPASLAVAQAAQLAAICQTANGSVRFFAKTKPTKDLTVYLSLFGKR